MTEKKNYVLIVDDEPDTQDYIAMVLGDNGYETATADNGQAALDSVQNRLPDLVTLDVSMPEKSGIKFYREMKGHDVWKAIPVIMVTGVAAEFEKFISSRKQVPPPDGYLSKPIDREKLIQMAGDLLA